MTDAFTAEGGCVCLAVRYGLTSPPLFTHACHCRWCQRETGSAFVLNAMIETARVVLPPGVPAVPEFHDRETVWPAVSRARRRAVLANG